MALFEYQAYDKSGGKVDGQIDAETKQEALLLIQQQDLLPSKITEIKTSSGNALFDKKVNLSDLEFFTSELSLLLESGVKIDRGIDIIKKTKAKPSLAKLLHDISKDLKAGKSLGETFKSHPDVFDDLYCNLIELGEASGNLSEVFSDLSKDLKFKRELRSKVIGSLTYPLVIFFVCILSIVFIFNFIIPKMSGMFEGVDSLPWYTQLMLDVSAWMINYQVYLFISIVSAIAIAVTYSKQAEGKKNIQNFMFSLPIVNKAMTTIERIRFNAGLAMMVKSGVPIDKGLKLSSGNIQVPKLRREMEIAQQKVKRGTSLTSALKQSSLYPDFFISLLEVGEESGNLARVFDEIAIRSRQEFEAWTSRITTLLEPLMILFMGIVVGGVVVIMLLSMVSINDIGV